MSRTVMQAAALAFAVLSSDIVLAGTDACQPVRDSIEKLNSTVKFQQKGIITYIGTGASYSLDYVAAGDKEFSRRDDGQWRIDIRHPVALVVDSKVAVYECSRVGVDRLESASAVVYTYKRLTPDHMVRHVKAWIAESSGQPLQTEMTIETEPDRKARFTFSYDPNAALPMVANP